MELNPAKLPPAATRPIDFARDIQPILEASCFKCHGPDKSKNGLRLDSREKALSGGDNGIDIIPGQAAKSPLVYYIARLIPAMEMPPANKGEPLTAQQVGLVRAWIDQGARFSNEASVARTAASQAREKLWSVQPLTRPAVPHVKGQSQPSNPIDAFVRVRLQEKGLKPSPEADARTLVRRLYYDLTGLPPTLAETEAFLADKDPKAYERLVDRLLASPRYGERWARHWLDVVHFGETHGYDKDQPRPNAWPYRDYVIRSFNQDKPYARFVQEQVAGDILFPETRDGIEALGFVSAGPWDLIGHAEVPETKVDGKVARHLDRDDMVMNTMQTFNSLTVQCAQCHNHKFDPIPQEDYYNLQAVFAAVDRTDRKYDPDPSVAKKRTILEQQQKTLLAREKDLNTRLATRAGQPLKDLDTKIAALQKPSSKGAAYGYHSSIEKSPDTAKWVQIDLGSANSIGSIVLHPCSDDFNGIGPGFGFPVRLKVEAANDAKFQEAVTLVTDHTTSDIPNPKIAAQSFDANGVKARFIRITATQLAPRQNDYIFALAEVEALTAQGRNVALGAPVSALDSIEAPVRWQKVNLTDGYYPGISSTTNSGELVALQKERDALLARAADKEEALQLEQTTRDLERVKTEVGKLPAQATVYIAAIHKGSGAFRGTGPDGGKPRPIYILNRGNVQKPGKEAAPGALSCVTGLPSRFELPASSPEGERRAALAKWLTSPQNPLTWRSIVNRVWQYHFGRGLVETANDFGNMGSAPTHPQLLDWLAAEFRDGGQSVKALHKQIVLSATYRQASTNTPAFAKLDSDNRFLWRMNRRKLEAE
ncbi:MAG TPA: DUF1549 domain-containing protein, partial [Candidatus Saccharimonadales bacterium]|nr:DUF1549 domain-containing protein [Candidatus Saccharimonadales bacterium]